MKILKMISSCVFTLFILFPLVSQASIPKRISHLFDPISISLNNIIISAPDIAENGAVISVGIKQIKNLPKGVYVTEILLFNDFRKEPIAIFKLGKRSLAEGLVTRIKMPKSGNVYAIAKLSNGKIFTGEKLIKVTVGGCGGGYGGSYTSVYYPSAELYSAQQVNTETYDHLTENGVTATTKNAISTFSIDVDTASYSNVRRFLVNQGELPFADAVRVEEMINYFDYHYPVPESEDIPFSITTEMGPTPWNSETKLLHIGLKGYAPPSQERPAANLVFLIDVSGSMARTNKLGLLKTSMKMLTRQLNANDRISLVVYAGASGVVLQPTPANQRAKIFTALESLSAGGSTNGGSGIKLAYAMAKQGFIEGGINRVLIATDGDFNVGTVNHNQLIDLIVKQRDAGISLTTLGFGTGNYNDHLMEQLADKGNGNSAYIDSVKEAKKVLVDQINSTLHTIAKDVKIQVQFNPDVVSEYRLIGYENRQLKREDFSNDKVDAGDIGAGHTVTALYEITLNKNTGQRLDKYRYQKTNTNKEKNLNEVAFLRLRYKTPDSNKSKLIERVLFKRDITDHLNTTSTNFKFSAAVAAFGQHLRSGKYIKAMSLNDIKFLADDSKGKDIHGYRREFLDMVDIALNLQVIKTQH